MRPLFSALLAVCLATLTFAETDGTSSADESNPYDPLAAVPTPLREAVKKVGRDALRWAYTQHTIRCDAKGNVKEDTVARFDPSQHYDVQWTLLTKDGQAATDAEIKKYRRNRAKQEKRRKPLGELIDLKRAVLVAEAPGAPELLTYVVPILPESSGRFPPDKVEVLMRVRAEARVLENIELRLKQPVRAMVVAKLKQGGALLEFATVQPEHAPVLSRIAADFSASVLFVPVDQVVQQTRSDFKRVTPYDERFNVKLGPLKTIDF